MEKTAPSIRSICVYCGSSPGEDGRYIDQARTLGDHLAAENIRLVYGGGGIGLMGAIAKAALARGGSVLGIIPEFLQKHERVVAAGDLEGCDVRVVPDMHTRKRMMFEEADAFVAMPGGIGTLEELVEIMTWAQLGRHDKPMALLNTNGFWDAFSNLVDDMAKAGFIHNQERIKPLMIAEADAIIPALVGAVKPS